MRLLSFTALLTILSPSLADVRYIEPGPGTSAAVVVPDHLPLLHTTQLLPADPKAAADVQVRQAFDALAGLLRDHGSGLERVVKVNAVLRETVTVALLEAEMARRFTGKARPALSLVVGDFPAALGIDAVATLPEDPKLQKTLVTKSAAVLPVGTRVWVSGQAETGGGDVVKATRLTMESLRRTLAHLRLKDDAIVQLKAFVHPMSQALAARREMESYFRGGPVPPIVFVEWLSKDSIEIELIAHAGRERDSWPVAFQATPELKPSPVYSRVARVNFGPLIYVSGLHPSKGGEAEDEIVDVFGRLGAVLDQAGSDYRHLVKATYYVTDDVTVKKMRELRPRWYDPERPPAASLARTAGTGRGRHVTLDMIAVPSPARDLNPYGPPGYGEGLSEADALAGWISLFDGKTTFGWKDAKIVDGALVAGSTTSAFGPCQYRLQVAKPGTLRIGPATQSSGSTEGTFALSDAAPFQLEGGIAVKRLLVKPIGLQALFNGKDLGGWKRIDRDTIPEKSRPTWTVENGALRSVGGPGALEYQDQFGDFVLQVDVRTRLRHSNGGLFLRAIPGDFMNGYEAQIFTRCIDNDVTRPAVWATGAIDDRQNARALMSRDGIPFKMTVVIQGRHIATWVNGHQTVDWTDERSPHINPRQGLRLDAGALQLQAHDPATDQEFRAIHARKW